MLGKPRYALAAVATSLMFGLLPGAPVLAGGQGACAAPYDPVIVPADFTNSRGRPNAISNPYLPLQPGTTYVFDGTMQGESLRDVVQVTRATKSIIGVTAVVVRETLTVGGFLAEDTFDWFAQDDQGTVWYFGEDTKEYDRQGNVISTSGSWEAGVGGARPGIIMEAQPKNADTYRQEFQPGVAEDMASVVSLSKTVSVPYGTFDDVVETKEFTCLATGLDHKYYAPGVGLVLDEELQLVSVTRKR